jgi:hypothetical protein
MSNNRYIEISSSYRNRKLWPLASNFDIPISELGTKNRFQALDPVCNASPTLYWNDSFRNDTAATSITVSGVDLTYAPSDPTTFTIVTGSGQLRREKNFYTGAVLSLSVGGTTVYRRITYYEYVAVADNGIVTIASALPDGTITTGAIQNPTTDTTLAGNPAVFIPSGRDIDNYYINSFIQNITTNETRTITAYDGTTHLATLSAVTAATWGNATTNQNFIIRPALSSSTGALLAVNGRILQLASTESNESESLVSSFIRMIDPVPTYPLSAGSAPYGEERRIVKYIGFDGTFVAHGGVGTATFTLSNNASSQDGYYINAILTDVTTGDDRLVVTYNGATRSGTVSSNWSAGAVGDVALVRTATLETTFSVAPSVGDDYEIETYTRDNATPFVYTGSKGSQLEPVCYEVELINLILPNSTITTARGGRIAFYPYVFVEFRNSVDVAASDGIIYSNNPYSYRMLFKAAIDDTPTPLISPFIKIDGDGMVQTIKFKPNDNLHFAVYLPGGFLFDTEEDEDYSPSAPNPLAQISALFSIRRLN